VTQFPDSVRLEEAEAAEHAKRSGAKANGAARTNGAKPFPFTLPKDITLEPKEWLIEGFLGRYETSAWFGPPDAGKSAAMTHAAGCVAAGLEFCGRKVVQGPMLYVAAERGAVVKRRVKAWCFEHGLPDIPLAILDHAVDLRTGRIDADRIIATAAELKALYRQSVVWIPFDTLNRVLGGGDENSSKDMGAVIASIDLIHRETGAHCSLIHHVPADRTDRMRGHSSVLGAVDMTVRITKNGNTVNMDVDKANDLVDKPRFAFTFKSVTICTDPSTGIETTAPVMVPTESSSPNPKDKTRKLSDRQKLALACLSDLESQPAPPAFKLPTGIRVAKIEAWRDELYRRGVLDREAKNPRAYFKQIRQSLQARQMIGERDGLIWPVNYGAAP
jgi:hypothetical protein